MKIPFKIVVVFLIISSSIYAQAYKQRLQSFNIDHYQLALELNDSTNTIQGLIGVNLKFRKSTPSFYLDFVSLDTITGKGMKVEAIHQNNVEVEFRQSRDRLTIYPKHNFPNLPYTYIIKYSGIPNDGLIIGKNMEGERTFFADNWPNRAKHWFPCVDHPSDKATIEYIIRAPKHYKIIANGALVEEIEEENIKQTRWKTAKPIPTKVMVIGAAEFAIDSLGLVDSIPVTSWVYPKNKEKGFYDFGNTNEILDFYVKLLGDYPYSKLASVQSSTRYGGMENASAIFYPEKAITGERSFENTIAHEIAHQWFGNAVTEIDWPHIWLSEGFATYFASLYVQHKQGDTIFQQRMGDAKERVLRYYETNKTAVVDTQTADYNKLLNTNSYQKGALVLHMLRRELGDDAFFKGIKAYYNRYQHKSVSTNTFKRIMAYTAGKNLDLFFKQWVEKPGHPILKTQWLYYNKKVRIMVEQVQGGFFEFPLDIKIVYEDGTSEVKSIFIDYQNAPYSIETSGDVKELIFDPYNWLLFDIAPEE